VEIATSKADLLKMWDLFDFKTLQTIAGNLGLSVQWQDECDCVGERDDV